MTRDEWRNYKDFDILSREMSGGFAANDLFSAGMTHQSAGSFLMPRDLKRPLADAEGEMPHAE